MVLNLQIKALIVSFVYGIILAYLIKLQYKYLFDKNKIRKVMVDSLFVFDNILIYFLILKYINNGIFHIYFLFLILIGFILGYYLIKRDNWHILCKMQNMFFYFMEFVYFKNYN